MAALDKPFTTLHAARPSITALTLLTGLYIFYSNDGVTDGAVLMGSLNLAEPYEGEHRETGRL